MILNTEFDVGQSVYKVTLDEDSSLKRRVDGDVDKIWEVQNFVIDRITATKKGIHYHMKGKSSVFYGGRVFASKNIYTNIEEAQKEADELNEKFRKNIRERKEAYEKIITQ